MDASQHLEHLRADASALLEAVRVAPDAPVPSCPGWSRNKVVKHLCSALGWAAVQAEAGPGVAKVFADAPRPAPGEDLLGFFDAVVDRSISAMAVMDHDATWPTHVGPRPGSFYPRRMAHEAAVHRWDVAGGSFSAALAADGIDELLELLPPVIGQLGRLDGTASALHLEATDVSDGSWFVDLGPDRVTGSRGRGRADATVRGAAEDLYLFAYNRLPLGGRLELVGDRGAAERWRAVMSM